MQPLTLADLHAGARALLALSEGQRAVAARALITRAALGDEHRKRTGHIAPSWGNGTLLDTAIRQPMRDPRCHGDPDYVVCLALILDAALELDRPIRGRLRPQPSGKDA